ncbi:hypothetical protein CFU_3515 [Collimonas fungivorans Ter331]|uniref:Uncharacterized protein n=3 Tax=Collimonas fungivorans TaxID=158899 RepID=G0AAP5_COLFT|nr:hypothetical protein CFU_3515 [Collimonas fungivorans Ter331]
MATRCNAIDFYIHRLEFDMSLSNIFSNSKLQDWMKKLAQASSAPDAEQAYLAAAQDHQDLERRLRVLDCRHGSLLHTLRVMKVRSY